MISKIAHCKKCGVFKLGYHPSIHSQTGKIEIFIPPVEISSSWFKVSIKPELRLNFFAASIKLFIVSPYPIQ